MINTSNMTNSFTVQAYNTVTNQDNLQANKELTKHNSLTESEVSISFQAQNIFNLEQTLLTEKDQKKLDAINKEIDQILGTEEIKLSKADEKSAEQIYQQMDKLFADNHITAEEEKTLTKLDEQLNGIYEKYEKPLTKEQEQRLDELFNQLDKIYGIENEGISASMPTGEEFTNKLKDLSELLKNLDIKLTGEDEKKVNDIAKKLTNESLSDKEAEKLDTTLNEIFTKYEPQYTKNLNKLDNLLTELTAYIMPEHTNSTFATESYGQNTDMLNGDFAARLDNLLAHLEA